MLSKYKTDISETIKLSLPIIFGRLGAVLMGVADTMMIGKVGTTEIAAAGIATSIFILVAIIPIGFLIVGSPFISACNSVGDKKSVVNILKGCVQSSVILSVIFMAILYMMAFNFEIFNQPVAVNEIVFPFFCLIIASTLPLMVFIAIEQFSDGLEKTQISMFFNVTGLLLNVAINYCLIYGNFGFPKLGLVGAGVGTLTARTYMCIGIWLVVKYKKAFSAFDLKFDLFTIEKESFIKLWKAGVPSGMQFFFEVSAFSVAAMMIGWLGIIPLAAHNVALSIASISYMLSTGFATGGSIRVAAAFGKGDKEAVLRAGKTSLGFVIILMGFSCLIFIFGGKLLTQLYTTDQNVIEIAGLLMVFAGLFQLSDGIQVVSLRALLGMEDIKIPTYITLFAYWVVGVPLGYVLTFYTPMGVSGMWLSLCIGLTISAFLVTKRFFKMVNGMPN